MRLIRSLPVRVRWLVCGYGWAVVCGIVALAAPISDSGQTLFAWNHALFASAAAGMLLLLAIGTLELRWRMRRHRSGPGFLSLVISACVMAFSLLGFVFGVLSIGAIALCVLMSSLPLRATRDVRPTSSPA